MRKIIVLGGGPSLEREVSLRSSQEVIKALRESYDNVDFIDPKFSKEYLNAASGTLVFPILHGEFGEDGTVQKELEQHSIAYLGADSSSSKVCFDKWLSRLALEKNNILIAKGELVDKSSYEKSAIAEKPHVLKAINGGSSIGTAIVRSKNSLNSRILQDVFDISSKAVIEELIEGVEITVSILDGKALPVVEIRPPLDEEFDYENKYNGKTEEICPAVSIDEQTQNEAKILAQRVNNVLNCRHLSRVDMIVRPDGKIFVLELNTMPGLTDQSLYPKAAKAAGLDFPELVKKFVKLVERDYNLI